MTTKIILERNRTEGVHIERNKIKRASIARNVVQQIRRKTKITCMPVISKGDTL